MKVGNALIFVGLLSACSNNDDEAFKTSYKAVFVGGCVKSTGGSALFKQICECQGKNVIKHFDASDLGDKQKVQGYVVKIAPRCVQEVMATSGTSK